MKIPSATRSCWKTQGRCWPNWNRYPGYAGRPLRRQLPRTSPETLALQQNDDAWNGRLRCPELALPTSLQPLYVQLDTLIAANLPDAFLERPPAAFPLDGLLQYQRADGASLRLFCRWRLDSRRPSGEVFTSTLTTTLPISLTGTLLDGPLLQPGYQTFTLEDTEAITGTVTAVPPTSVLAVRGPDGVYDAEWTVPPDHDAIRFLNELLNALLQAAAPVPTDPDAAGTPASTEVPAGETPATPEVPDGSAAPSPTP
ncbi:MAG: hypothetical protein M5U34_11810 [Chloroflexi bacterium]|nr:hypothetical protein [Chloroflexota bacterium]